MKNIITYTVNKNYENELYLSVQNGEKTFRRGLQGYN